MVELIKEMLRNTKTIAVIGAKQNVSQPAYRIPFYMHLHGYKMFPVNPFRTNLIIFDEKVIADVSDLNTPVDMVNIFRKPEFLTGHAEEILKMKTLPKYVWFQLGIYNDVAAKMLEDKGIKVVQNRCLMVEHSIYM